MSFSDLSGSQLLLDGPPDSCQFVSSLGSSDTQPLGRSLDLNTVKKRPEVNRGPVEGHALLTRGNLFGSGLSAMHEDSELDASVVNIHFDTDELDLLDDDFSHSDDDDEHEQGEGQESDEDGDQGQGHGEFALFLM